MGMNRTPLLFPVIYLFLYFSHQSTLWLNVSLNFEMHNLVLCWVFFPACLLHLTSAHLPVLSDFISHLFYSLSAFFDFVSLSLFSVHLPPFLCRCTLLSSPCSLPLSADCIPFALAQLSAACFSCTHTCTHLHICVHAHDSVEESPR